MALGGMKITLREFSSDKMALPRVFNLKMVPTIVLSLKLTTVRCRVNRRRCKKCSTLKKAHRHFYSFRNWRMMFWYRRDSMRYQRSALSHRVLPPSLRPHQSAIGSHLRHPNKLQWFVTWLTASVLSLVVLGVLLAMHC